MSVYIVMYGRYEDDFIAASYPTWELAVQHLARYPELVQPGTDYSSPEGETRIVEVASLVEVPATESEFQPVAIYFPMEDWRSTPPSTWRWWCSADGYDERGRHVLTSRP